MWDFCNSPAFIVTNKGRGRSAYKSIYHNNYYCQVKKIGTLFSWTNWQAIKHHPVELSFIFGLWKAYKLSSEAAIVQMRYARDRGMQGYLNEINEDRRWKSQVRERAEKSPGAHDPIKSVSSHRRGLAVDGRLERCLWGRRRGFPFSCSTDHPGSAKPDTLANCMALTTPSS